MKPTKKYAIPALLTLTVLTTLFLLFSGVVGASPPQQTHSLLPGHLVPALRGHTPLGATDGQQMLSLTISLRLADSAGLQGLINAQNDTHSPLYHQYITPQQFTAHYAPTQASVDSVISFLRSQGLAVQSVAANRLSITAKGTVATVERAFNVHLSNYSLNGYVVYAPTSNPSVPSSLAGLILNIGGLDNTSTPHRLGGPFPETGKAFPGGGPNGGGYTPSNLRTAYDMNNLISADNGANQTVALLELDGYNPGDIDNYLSHYGLGSARYSNVLVDGADGTPSTLGGALEVELDMEVMSAIAPGAAQKVYIAPNNNFQNFYDDFNQIVTDDKAQVVSDSWGLCELDTGTANMAALDAVFQEGAAQGQAFFAASGDAGAYDCNQPNSPNLGDQAVDFPASDPNVVGVGGTALTINSNSTYKSETAWSCSPNASPVCANVSVDGAGSGGGLSIYFGQPGYQTGPGVINSYSLQGPSNCTLASFTQYCREVPDVSANASQNTPYSEYCTDASGCGGLGWIQVFGTSAAAPLWAGVATDLNEYLRSQSKPTLGSAGEPLYWLFNTTHPYTPYHDITTGDNLRYIATKGYDLATGTGTPDVWNIARDFAAAALSVTPSSIYLATTSGTDPGPQIVTITNSGYSPYHWSLGLPAGISANVTTGTIAPKGAANVTLSFSLGNTPQAFTGTIKVNDVNGLLAPLSIPVTVVEASVSKTWYFAEGYTGGSFTEYLTLANPNNAIARVQVVYLLGSGATMTKPYALTANSRLTILVNHEVGQNQNVSMVVTSDQPIVAERPMYFTFTGLPGYAIPGGTDVLGATRLANSFDFGYLDTTTGHATYLTILNQNTSALSATVKYFPASGGAPIIRSHNVAAHSRGTVFVNNDVPKGSYSALVTLSLPGLVERPLYLKDSSTGYTGAADVVGVATPQKQWDFAEGYTSSTFTERYILSNPGGAATAHATVTFFRSNGTTATKTVTLAPGVQVVVSANSVLGSSNVNNSAQVISDQPILAERYISFKYVGPAGPNGADVTIPGASDVLGANAPGNLFYFAEGYTGATFAEYLTIENPSPTATATVRVTFLPPTNGREPTVEVFQIGHSSRFTLFTGSIMKNQSFSMVVESNVAIVAERPMYFIYSGGGQTGGSDVIGYQPAGGDTPPPPPPPPTPTPTPPPTPTPTPPPSPTPTPTSTPPTSSSTVYTGSTDGYEYALDPTTGNLVWKYQTSGGVSTACFANGVVYFGSSDGYFYAVNASDGTLDWRDNIGSSTYAASSVVNGVVYLVSLTGTLYALDGATGSTIWSYATGGQNFAAAPTVANGMVYVSVEQQGITALNASTGAVVWSYTEPFVYATTPAVDNGMVYFISTGDDRLHALDASTGAAVWTFAGLGSTSANLDSPTAVNGVVYAIDLDGGAYAFNGTTGAKLWNTPVPASGAYNAASAPTVANGIVYVGNFDGALYAYSASDGSLLWYYPTNGIVESVPTIANGIVYFGSEDGYIYALHANDGALIWRYQTGNQVNSTPIVAP